jgi:hypothetical protein
MSDDAVVQVDASRVNLKLEQMPEDVRAALLDTVIDLGGTLVDLARSRAETLLQVKTGKFVSRIRFGLKRRKNTIAGRVYSSDPTAALFEWGGKTGAHDILPNKAQALMFTIGGKTSFFAGVHHPGGTYAARNIIHGAFDPMEAQIAGALEDAVDGAVAKR